MSQASPASINAATLRKRVLSWPTLVAIIIGGGLLAFALWRVFDFEWSDLWDNVSSINPWYYLLAFVLYYISFWFRGLRWRLIALTADLDGVGGRHTPGPFRLAGIILMGWFANSVAFFRLGDAYRGWSLATESKSNFPSSLGTVLAERVQDMVAVLLLVLIAAIWIAAAEDVGVPGAVLLAAVALVSVLIAGLLVMHRFGERVASKLPYRLRDAYINFQTTTLSSFRSRALPPQILLGIVGWLLEIARFYFVTEALGIDVGFGVVMFAALANAMLTTIPTPGGFGFVEGGMVGLLVLLGVDDTEALSLVVVDRTISWLSVIVTGGTLFTAWHIWRARNGNRTEAAEAVSVRTQDAARVGD